MDKSWITAPIASNIFKNGVENFINFASVRAIRGSIVCPCPRCCNCKLLVINSVHAHILRYGFLPGYTTWKFHGEHVTPSKLSESSSGRETIFPKDDMIGLVRDALGVSSIPLNDEEVRDSTFEGESAERIELEEDDITYKRLLEECDNELYSGCKYTNLSFTLHLYHVKCIGGISNNAFGMLLELLRDAFPHITSLPSSANEAKKLTKDLGVGYEKIHACPNDCMLYWGDRKDQQSCHKCKAPRYKTDVGNEGSKSSKSNKPSKLVIKGREANDVEFFRNSHLMKNGLYAKHASRQLLDRAQEGIARKVLEVGSDSIDSEKQSEIVREVMQELRGPNKRGRPPSYGVGVKRSQVTKFSFDLRKLRGKNIANENRFLLDKIDTQSKQIESQREQIETQSRQIESQSKQMLIMQQSIDDYTAELRLFRTAFSDFYGARMSTTPQTSSRALHQDHL